MPRNPDENLAALEQSIAYQEGLLHDIEKRLQAEDEAALPHDVVVTAEAIRLRQAIYVLKTRRSVLAAGSLRALRRG